MVPASREKPRYLAMYLLLDRLMQLRSSKFVLSSEGLEEEEEQEEEEQEEQEEEEQEEQEQGGAETDEEEVTKEDKADMGERLALGYEERVPGLFSAGPVEFVLLRLPDGLKHEAVLDQDLASALQKGCKAALVVELKAAIEYDHFWQALCEAVELARKNGPGSPVTAVFTDMSRWYFFTVELLEQPVRSKRQAPKSGLQAPPGASRHEGAAGGQATQAGASGRQQQQAAGAAGLDFETLDYIGSTQTFRLSNCLYLEAHFVKERLVKQRQAVEVLYRLYRALYPEEDIEQLPEQVKRGQEEAERRTANWVRKAKADPVLEPVLEQLAAAQQQAAAEKQQRLEAEQQRLEAEQRAAAEKQLRLEVERKLQELQAKLGVQ